MLGIYNDKTKDFPIDNYFNILNHSTYKCFVKEYSYDHSYLTISPIKDGNYLPEDIPFRLEFSSVLYFEGPLQWHGANFSVARPDDCLKLLRRFKEYESLDDTTLLGHHVLFTIETSDFVVKILAAQGYFVKVQPQDLL